MNEPRDTYCPYCGNWQPAHPETDVVYCTECDHPCVPVPFEELEQFFQDLWNEE